MFDADYKYSDEIQKLINETEKQKGLEVVKVKFWSIPVYNYELKLEITKSKNLNIIEEFIIKIALLGANSGKIVFEEDIRNMLGLDEIFTKTYINKLAEIGIIESSKLPSICITEIGKDQYKKGQVLTKDKTENLSVYIQPKFKLLYSKLKDQPEVYAPKVINEYVQVTAEKIERDFMDEIINIAKEQNLVVNRESINQYVSKISTARNLENPIAINFVEIWTYDIVEDKVFCRVWDCQRRLYDAELSEYINVNNPLSRKDYEAVDSESDEYTIFNDYDKVEPNKYEIRYKEEIKAERDGQALQNSSLRMVRGAEIKKEFNKVLKSSKKYLYIHSPWISENVVDNKMIEEFKRLANSNCKIFISWGMDADINKEKRMPPIELLNKLKMISGPDGLPGLHVCWIGNHHNKEIIVDDSYHLIGSFNWLSYRGDYLPRGESVCIISDKASIQEAKTYWENLIFQKSKDIDKDDYIIKIDALLNLKTKASDTREIVMNEVEKLFKKLDSSSITKLFNIALVYYKNNLIDDVYIYIISKLIETINYVKYIFLMLLQLKKNNNAKLYNEMVEKYQAEFIKAGVINEKLIAEKSLTKKNVKNELLFK